MSEKMTEESMQKEKEEEDRKNGEGGENKEKEKENGLPLMALNHVSRLCRSVEASVEFYVNVLGFVLVKRPKTFDFSGAWLFNYGVGIHLMKTNQELPSDTDHINPMDNHISFQCEDMDAMERKLTEMNIKYIKRSVEDEKGTMIDQLFFKDPDGFMIEICNCENLELVPSGSLGRLKLPFDRRHSPPVTINH